MGCVQSTKSPSDPIADERQQKQATTSNGRTESTHSHKRSPSVSRSISRFKTVIIHRSRTPSGTRLNEPNPEDCQDDVRIVHVNGGHRRSATHLETMRVEMVVFGQKIEIPIAVEVKQKTSLDVPHPHQHQSRRAGTDEAIKKKKISGHARSPSFQQELDRKLEYFKREQAKLKSHEFKTRTSTLQTPAPARRVQSSIN